MAIAVGQPGIAKAVSLYRSAGWHTSLAWDLLPLRSVIRPSARAGDSCRQHGKDPSKQTTGATAHIPTPAACCPRLDHHMPPLKRGRGKPRRVHWH